MIRKFVRIIDTNAEVSNTTGQQLKDLLQGSLNDNIISAFLELMNRQKVPEQMFVYFSPVYMDQTQINDFLESDYKGQDKIHIVLHVGKDDRGDVYISDAKRRPGNHYAYLCFNVKERNFNYSDSLTWGIPKNLQVIFPLLNGMLAKHPESPGNTVPQDPDVRHVQELSTSHDKFVVKQTCGSMCGIAALLPCVAAMDHSLWEAVNGRRPENDPYLPRLFSCVTSYSTELRITFIKWLVNGAIDITDLYRLSILI